MKVVDAGTFDVAPNEQITVDVEKSVAPYTATVSDLIGAAWAPQPQPPVGLKAYGAFVAPAVPASLVSFTVDCDFVPGADGTTPPGDKYTITIKGRPNEDTRRVTVFPPGLQSRSYLFRVV